jgi:CHAT domain-containing protein
LQSDLKAWGTNDAVIISTIIGADRLQIIVTTPNVQEPHTIEISSAKLNGLVADFRNALKDPRIDPRPAGQKLYEVLLKPIETDLAGAKAKTLIWSLDGTLRYVPLAALWDGQHYLVERFQNVVIALASRSKMAREPLAVSQWRALGLGVSKGWGNFPPLDAVPEELKGIVRQDNAGGATAPDERGVLPGRRLLDADFTRSNLERALGRYSIIHIASHFDFLPGKEKSSFLLLGDGTGLTLDAISSSTPLFDKVELLTLSACNTATGSDAEGAEVEGFGVLAQKQGALAVLATLWEVADASTGQLMREFYRLREANPQWTKAEALRQAQLELLTGQTKVSQTRTQRAEIVGGEAGSSSQPSFTPDANAPLAHPYYWAPFILIGNWK